MQDLLTKAEALLIDAQLLPETEVLETSITLIKALIKELEEE